MASLAFKKENLIKILVSSLEIPFTSPTRNGLPSPKFKSRWFDIRDPVRNFGESGAQRVDVPPIFQGDLTLKPLSKSQTFKHYEKEECKNPFYQEAQGTLFSL